MNRGDMELSTELSDMELSNISTALQEVHSILYNVIMEGGKDSDHRHSYYNESLWGILDSIEQAREKLVQEQELHNQEENKKEVLRLTEAYIRNIQRLNKGVSDRELASIMMQALHSS